MTSQEIDPRNLFGPPDAPHVRLAVDVALSMLDPQREEVLVRRFGLRGHVPQTQYEVADALKKHRSRIDQLEDTGLETLRREARFLLDFID